MDYESFLSYVKENILYYMDLEEEVDVELLQVVKNNGITLDGMTIRKKGERMSPNMYLNSYYSEYERGKSIENIMMDIAAKYKSVSYELDISVDDICDFEKIKDHIILRLVGYEKNKKQLENCPYIMFEDLAITFRWLVCKEKLGIATVLITNRELEQWGKTADSLYELALKNTETYFPAHIEPLGNMLSGYLKDIFHNNVLNEKENHEIQEDIVDYIAEEQLHPTLYVLTNDQGLNGATSLIYPHVIDEFADSMGHDFYVLPSSIHEVILVPDTEEITAPQFYDMVSDANDTVVLDSEVLSDSVYYYSRNEKVVKRVICL